MMSISPQRGHCPIGSGSIQIAGQVPRPTGSFARISKRPYFQACRLLSRTDVKPLPSQASFRASIRSLSLLHACVFFAALRVELKLVVAPAVSADLVVPLRRIGQSRPLELVAPKQLRHGDSLSPPKLANAQARTVNVTAMKRFGMRSAAPSAIISERSEAAEDEASLPDDLRPGL